MRLIEEKHDEALKKHRSAGGVGDPPSAPSWQAYSQKYGSVQEWQDLCVKQHKRTPFQDLPQEAQARLDRLLDTATTTSGTQEKSQAVQSVTATGWTP